MPINHCTIKVIGHDAHVLHKASDSMMIGVDGIDAYHVIVTGTVCARA
jgi:hypothetical protein